MEALKRHAPTLAVALVLAGYGAWANAVGLADPDAYGPRTMFTPGQYLAAAIGWSQVQLHGLFGTRTELLGWPDAAEFRVVMWPTQVLALLVGPLPAVNLVFAFAPALNVLAGACLGATLGLDRWQRAALGGLLGWSPWVRETLQNGQLEQVVVGVVALLWMGVLRAVEPPREAGAPASSPAGRRGWLLLSPLLTLAAGFTAPHLCLAAFLGLGAWGLVACLRDPRAAPRWLLVLVTNAAALLFASRYHSANFGSQVQVFFPKGSAGHPSNLPGIPEQADLVTLLTPPLLSFDDVVVVHPTWLGSVVVLAALAGARRAAYALPAGVAALALALFSFGPRLHLGGAEVPGPYALLGLLSASVAQSGSAYRVVGALTVAVAALAAPLARGPRTLAALVLAAWIDTTVFATRPLPFLPMDFRPDPHPEVFRGKSGAILDLPMLSMTCPISPYHYVFEATRKLRPVPILPSAAGYYPTIPGAYARVYTALNLDDCGTGLAEVIAGIGFEGVVLHRHDALCPVPRKLERCLEEAFGPGERADGVRWWDPIPPPPSGRARGSSFPERPPGPGEEGHRAPVQRDDVPPPPPKPHPHASTSGAPP